METRTDIESRKKVFELIKDIHIALLVTHGPEGKLHARPMAAVELKEFSGELWFFTAIHSPKVEEIRHDPHILLSYAKPDGQNYVSINGIAEIVQDRAIIKQLWTEKARPWFPKGAEDSELALIKVTASSAEYWDARASAAVYLYGYLKARFTGEAPDKGENKKVVFS